MMQLGMAMMTYVIPTAPLPAVLPEYSMECRAGEMTGGKTRFLIEVSGDAKARTAKIQEGSVEREAKVEVHPIPRQSSVGNIGFVDMIKFQEAGQNGFMRIEVRGPIEDDLVTFFTTDRGSKKSMQGSCNLVAAGREINP